MKIHVDRQIGAISLTLDESSVVESEEVQPGVVLDFDEQGNVVGIEILGLKDRIPPVDLKRLQVEYA